MNIKEYLSGFRETCPVWLANFKKGRKFDSRKFFSSRVVFYPGAGSDGHAVKLFGSSHAAHCFVYADYLVEKSSITGALDNPGGGYGSRFLGYRSFARIELTPAQITPEGWIPHETIDANRVPEIVPYGFLEILEREDAYGDDHGAHRLAILFLGADGFATYDELFCQRNQDRPPYAVLIQDHGYGGNNSRFGGDGLLERLARIPDRLPDWLIVAGNTTPWQGYKRIENVDGDSGGMHAHLRYLYGVDFNN